MELMDKKYWSVEEASQALGLSISTVRRRIRTGGIIAIQPGGPRTKLMIPVDAPFASRADDIPEIAAPSHREVRRGPKARWKQKRY